MRSCPSSLYKTALDFLVKNLVYVESLKNIPEIVGEDIFNKAVTENAFVFEGPGEQSPTADCASPSSSFSEIAACLDIFLREYYGCVIYGLNLRDSLLLLNEYTDPLVCLMRYVVELDLSGCHLGNNHEVLEAMAEFTKLKRLRLKDNELSDDGMRKLTLPTRMFSKGPKHLQELDISSNPKVGDKIIPWLACFPELQCLDISWTGITDKGIALACSKYGLLRTKHKLDEIKTSGWAGCVVVQWQEKLQQHKKPKSPTKGFFTYRKKLKTTLFDACRQHSQEEMIVLKKPNLSNG